MPASALSLICSAATGNTDAVIVDDDVPADLLAALRAITDPRCRRGVRHQLVAVLGAAVCAVLAGARSYVAIAEWAHDLPAAVRKRLGIERHPPSETAFRRVLQAVDPHLLDRTVSGWLVARAGSAAEPSRRWRAVAIDGKTARGARGVDGRAVHLLAALEHADGVVLGQRVVDEKSNEIKAFAPLLEGIDITGVIVTADALHTQREHAQYLIGRGGHYLFTVKANQPKLHAQLMALPWQEIPAADVTRDAGHGRAETRTVKLTAVSAGIGFPHAATAVQITRRRRPLNGRRWRTEIVYVITDLDQTQIHPDEIADLIRSHWHIENRLHWVRDVTFAEDHSQILRARPGRDGRAAQPRHQRAPPSRRDQYRRRDPPRVATSQPHPPSAATRQDQHGLDNAQINFAEALVF